MKLKALPRSKAKTAWGLVQDVKRAIREEPKRANMQTVMRSVLPSNGGPACGTVGCFRGWLQILGRQASEDPRLVNILSLLGDGLNYRFAHATQTCPIYHVFNAGGGDSCEYTRPGTRAHARAVIARINRFAKKNEAKLKAHRLPGR